MQLIKVERKRPETFKECDQLLFCNNCRNCAFGDYKGPACEQRKIFINAAIKAGKLVLCTDSNNEEVYREVY
ncbi:MAG: hypothetical protein PHQ88_07515 [Bacteroides sp.]|nr:hypothetical protein [Bacteroides sp.]